MYLTGLYNYYNMRGFILTFALVFLAWISLTMSFSQQELVLGFAVSLAITLIADRFMDPERPEMMLNPRRWDNIIAYLAVLIYAEIASHIDVMKRVFTGRLNPAIVEIETKLKSNESRMILANSITMTPGTLTVRAGGKRLYVHTIAYESRKRIGEMFERYWGRVME